METYDKDSQGHTAGFMYQSKLLTLCMLRGLSHRQDFRMATEMVQTKVGKYDDVVFYFRGRGGERRCFLVQAKHTVSGSGAGGSAVKKIYSQTLLSDKEKDFGLGQYLHSYLERIKGNEELALVDALVLFTNRTIDNRSLGPHVRELQDGDRQFIRFCRADQCGRFYSLSADFVRQLRAGVLQYYLAGVSRDLTHSLLYKKAVELCGGSALQRFQASLYGHILCFTAPAPARGERFVKNFKQNFIDGDKESLDGTVLQFRACFMEHFRIKSINFAKEISKTDSSVEWSQFTLEDFQDYFEKVKVKVCGCSDPDTEHDSPELLAEHIVSEEDLREFAGLFVLAVSQPNVDSMDDSLEEALRQHSLCQTVDPRIATRHLLPHMNKWLDSKDGYFINLNQGNDILRKIHSELILSSVNVCTWGLAFRNISFEKSHVRDLDSVMAESAAASVHVSCSGSTKLLAWLLRHAATTRRYPCFESQLLVELSHADIDIVRFLEESDSINGVVVDLASSASSQTVKALLACGKRVVLVTPRDTPVDRLVNKLCGRTLYPPETKFEHLTRESQQFLLSREIFDCHGRACSLRDFVARDHLHCIDANVLQDLIVGAPVCVGAVGASLCTLPAAYTRVHHTITPEVFMLLLSREGYKLAVSGDSGATIAEESLLDMDVEGREVVESQITHADSLDADKKIVLFRDDDLEKFHQVCRKIQSRVVFWICIENGTLYLVEIYNREYYVKRQLRQVQSVSFPASALNKYLRGDQSDTKRHFIVSGGRQFCQELDAEWEQKGDVAFCRVEEAEGEFTNKCRLNDEVHWLESRRGQLRWIKSHGSLDFVRKCVTETGSVRTTTLTKEEIFFDELKNRAVLISDEAGTGKTTTLVSMCSGLAVSKCVYMVDLKDVTAQGCLDNLMEKKVAEKECVLRLLGGVPSKENSLLRNLLMYLLVYKRHEEPNGLVLIFDGIDEVPQQYQEAVIRIAQFVMRETECRVCITTRGSSRQLLEDKLSLLAASLEELHKEDQVEFILKHWTNNPLALGAKHLHHQAVTLLDQISAKVSQDTCELTASPLYLRLIAEISLGHLAKGGRVETLVANARRLIEEFVDTKYAVYLAGKRQHRRTSLECRYIDSLHAEFAFQTLFPSCGRELGLDADTKILEESNTFLAVGVLYSRLVGHLDFRHRTLCEYFCAIYLVNCLENETRNPRMYEMARQLLSQEWFWPGRDKHLEMLAKLINSVLWGNVQDSLSKGATAGVDAMGRSLEHLCHPDGTGRFCKAKHLLMKSGLSSELSQDILGRTPLHYAIGNKNNLKFLSRRCQYFDENYQENILHDSSRGRGAPPRTVYSARAAFETSQWNRILNARDVAQRTALSYAAEAENWAACGWLLLRGADCTVLNIDQAAKILEELSGKADNPFESLDERQRKYLCVTTLLLYNFPALIRERLPGVLATYLCEGHTAVVEELVRACACLSDEMSALLRRELWQLSAETFQRLHLGHLSDVHCLALNEFLSKHGIVRTDHAYIKSLVEWGFVETVKYVIGKLEDVRSLSFCEYMELAIQHSHHAAVEYMWRTHGDLTVGEDGSTPLMSAASLGSLHFVKYLCDNGCDARGANESGMTALHFAAESGQPELEVVEYLVGRGADVNSTDSDGLTALDYMLSYEWHHGPTDWHAIFQCVSYLVLICEANSKWGERALREEVMRATHRTVNARAGGTTLLHRALGTGSALLVKRLLALGADVHAKDDAGFTVLMRCQEMASPVCTMLLFRHGRTCCPHHWQPWHALTELERSTVTKGGSLLHVAARHGKLDEVRCLVENGCMFDAVDDQGLTPKQYLIDNADGTILDRVSLYFRKVKENDLGYIKSDEFEVLLYNKHYRDKLGRSLLHWAVDLGHSEMAAYLLVCEADTEAKDFEGKTPLHYAIRHNSLPMTHTLLRHGAVYDPVDRTGRSLLEAPGSPSSSADAVRIIHGIFVSIRRHQPEDAIRALAAMESCQTAMSAAVHARDRLGCTLLHTAAARGHVDVVKIVLKNGCRYDSQNFLNETALEVTRSRRAYSLLSTVAEPGHWRRGAALDEESVEGVVRATNKHGNTWLHRATDARLTRLLVEHSADINAINRHGETPLMVALRRGRYEVARVLLRGGARTDVRDVYGNGLTGEQLGSPGLRNDSPGAGSVSHGL